MIHIYGDSHADHSFRGLALPHRNYHQTSVTMFRIGRDNTIVNFDTTHLSKDNILCFAYGEVDCRCHIQRQINAGRIEDEIIQELVHSYFKTIENNITLYKNIIVVGVIPPTRQSEYEAIHGPILHDFPFIGTDDERVRYTQKVNSIIQGLCNIYRYIYFNPYEYYTREDGTLRYELSDHIVHIGDTSFFLQKFNEVYARSTSELINDSSNHPHIILEDIYKVFIVENCIEYTLINYDTHSIKTGHTTTEDSDHYLVIDLLHNDAFGHWVFESAIYLPLFQKLKNIYKNLKLVLKERRVYKLLFTNYFHIEDSDIVYSIPIDKSNVCFFPSPISLLNSNNPLTQVYKDIISSFVCEFNIPTESNVSNYEYIVMPRQSKENYVGNDRFYDFSYIYKSLEEKNKRYFVLNTDTITVLTDQITMVRNTPRLIVADGSAFLVNNIFCKNQHIIVVGNHETYNQSSSYVRMKYIIESVSEINGNSYEYVKTSDTQPPI